MRNILVIAAVAAAVGMGIWVQSILDRGDDATGGDQATGAALAEVSVPVLEGDAALGQVVYEANCAACHGANAAGQDGVAPALVHNIYRPGHHGDATFLLAVRNGVRAHHWRFGSMLPVEGLSDDDVALVVAYVRALQRENGIN